MIQCKRHKEDNLVDVNVVKALYADVEHESSKYGLIATTSRITPEGERIISARGYPIETAEFNEIKNMIYYLWREPFRL